MLQLSSPFRNLLSSAILALAGTACAYGQEQGNDDEMASRLAELSNQPLVISSRLDSQVFNAPAGSFVFDQHDIESLPVDSIPELLRYAPGVHIIRPNNGIWGMGIRGINSRFFNRALFTVDEQNVYASIFAGLFGSQHDLLLEDVSSIEVAYGPGGGTWDNNAVNGMVNVRMKTAFETEGALLKASVGTESHGLAARYGWAVNDATSARVFLKASHRDSSFTRFDYSNEWDTARTGFRIDYRPTSRDLLSLSTEAFYSDLGYAYNLANFDDGSLTFQSDPERLNGGNAQLKWTRNTSSDSSYSIRSWLAYSDLDAAYAAFGMWTSGIEGRAESAVGDNHVLSVNLGAAYDQENTASTLASDFTHPLLESFAVYSGFQDKWTLIRDSLSLSWGVDFRYDDRSEELITSPNARILFELNPSSRLWVSYSQANRTPPVSLSVIESLRSGKALDAPRTIPTPGGPVTIEHSLTNAISNTLLDPEELDAFEAGYRLELPDGKSSLMVNAFYYRYDELIGRIGVSSELELSTPTPYVNIVGSYTNLLEGEASGFEASFDYALNDANSIQLNYSLLSDQFDPVISPANDFERSAIQFSLDEFDNSTPGHTTTLNWSSELSDSVNMDTGFRYSSGYDFAKGYQPSIFQMDARIDWQKTEQLKLSLVGRNLLDPTTQEARLKDYFGHWAEMKREVYLEISAQF